MKIKKIFQFAIASLIIISVMSCEKEVVDISNISELYSIEFADQIGSITINLDSSTISFAYAQDLNKVTISKLVLSEGANANLSQGDVVDFTTPNNVVSLNITSESGKVTKTYTLKAIRHPDMPNPNSKCELLGISFLNQVAGNAKINYATKTVTFNYTGDFKTIKISNLQISSSATSNLTTSTSEIDFSKDSTAILVITGTDASTLSYKLIAKYYLPFIGQYKMSDGYTKWWGGFWGETPYRSCISHDGIAEKQEYKYYDFTSSSVTADTWDWWLWYTRWKDIGTPIFNNGSEIYDNTLNMVLSTSVSGNKIIGTFVYGPGMDGKMGSFTHTNTQTGNDIDLNSNYNVLSVSGTWEANMTTGTITFTGANGSVTTTGKNWTFETVDMGSGVMKQVFKFWLPVNKTGLNPAISTTDEVLKNLNYGNEILFVFVKD